MRHVAFSCVAIIGLAMLLSVLAGCMRQAARWDEPPMVVCHDNPTLVPMSDHNCVWETVADVMDDYFDTEREEPVRLVGETLTEGRIDTFPRGASTILEPWNTDSVGIYEKTESSLQSIRRRAIVRVIPAEQGFWIDVAVLKELEDVTQPDHATAGAATFRYDDSFTRVVDPISEQDVHIGWIPKGRDTALEQRIIGHLQSRFGNPMYLPR
jgi:hypothetical protein